MAEILTFPDPPAVAKAAAELFVQSAADAIANRGSFAVALSGGSTPKLLFNLIASDPYRSRIDWPNIEIYFADERAVPPDHADSNFKLANDTLLSRVPLKPENIHRMRGETEPSAAAIEYGQMLKSRFGDTGGPDLTLLGMGDDGHTASLFPHTPALAETRHRCAAQFVENSTTGPSWRITLTAPFINRSTQIWILVTGPSKAARLREVLHGPSDPKRLPVQLIAPAAGKMLWFLDHPAASQLPVQP
jgi:6-phosphogluconolactonase